MTVELLTKEDLYQFKTEFFSELKQLLQNNSAPTKKWLKSYEVREMLGISNGTLQHMNNRMLFPSQMQYNARTGTSTIAAIIKNTLIDYISKIVQFDKIIFIEINHFKTCTPMLFYGAQA